MILIDRGAERSVITLDKTLTTFGPTGDFDMVIEELEDASFSILSGENSLKMIPVDKLSTKKIKGRWNEPLTGLEVFKGQGVTLVVMPGLDLPKANELPDWDFSKLPKDPRKNDYPQRLLDFILESVGLSEGGLFHRLGGNLQAIGQKNLKIKDRSEIMLNEFIEESHDELLLRITFDTHTVLFEAGLNPANFLLIRSKLTDDGEIVLYLPEPAYSETIPEGILSSMLYFASHAVSLHLAYRYSKRLISLDDGSDYYWGKGAEMQRIKKLCDKLAKADLSVVISGETGSGKEGIAAYFASKTAKKLVAVNCSAIPANLAESTLFGHIKGSFTGAVSNQIGKIVESDGGILFLDEIGELSLEIQAKLLRFLQSGVVTPVGGREIKVKVRVIAATHRDLTKMVSEGTFREDLYYRICETNITLPPLRERLDDIGALATLFLDQAIEANDLEEKLFSPASLEHLKSHSWPGNIRELRALVRKVAIISDGNVIENQDLNQMMSGVPGTKNNFPMDLASAKKMLIEMQVQKALKMSGGNRNQAATILGVTPRTLFRLMAENGVIESDKNVSPGSITN